MGSQLGYSSRRRGFLHRHGLQMFLILLVTSVLALVAFLIYTLTSPNWRPRW